MSVQRSVALVDVAAVPDGDDEDEEHVVVDLVDDPVVAGAGAPLAVTADELLRPPTSFFAPLGRGWSARSSMAAWILRLAEVSSLRS